MNHGPIIWAAAAFVCLIGQTAVVLQASCEASVGDHLKVECDNRGPFISVTWIGRSFRSRDKEGATPTRLTPEAKSSQRRRGSETPSPKNLTRPSCCSLRLRKNDHFPRSDDRKPTINNAHSCLSSFPNEASPSHADAEAPTPWFVFLPNKSVEDFSVVTCQGSDVTMVCESKPNHDSVRVSWKRRSRNDSEDVHLSNGPVLELVNVKSQDGGSYVCQAVSGEFDRPVERELNLVVEYPPVILVEDAQVRGSRTRDCRLRCVVDAFPEAIISWYKDEDLLGEADDERYKTALESNGNCTMVATLLILILNDSISTSANDSVSSPAFGNYSCVAENKHGKSSAVLTLVAPHIWDARVKAEEVEPRRFNVTGFIVGMMPPLFISFYIILKLGYRSRYAQEHPEDDGGREEPFFVSY